ncbi:MAG: hypothetical protein U0610_32820 [bacterium]
MPRRSTRRSLLLLTLLVPLGSPLGCGSSSSTSTPTPTPDTMLVHVIDPSSTDPAISSSFDSHQTFLETAVAPNGKLLLFLPGTDAEPRAYQRLLAAAAAIGYHAIGLAYPNSESVATLCDGDPACYEPVRLEIFDGVDRSDRVSVDAANSIENRTVRLLQYLAANFPNEGWDEFLANGALRYGAITVAGHSQGGGEAAMIAKIRTVSRVAMFSAPIDAVDGVSAPWINTANETPANRYFGFAHESDPAFADIATNWQSLGMGSAADRVLVDNTAAPYGGAHQLETALSVSRPHNSTAVDSDTPTTLGQPIYRDVWRTVLGG